MKKVNQHKHEGHSHENGKVISKTTSLATPHSDGKQKHQRVKKYMFKKPAPLNTWDVEEHRSESWMELFIDLFYVAFFIKLGDIFYTCGFTVDSVIHVCAVFLGIYMSKFDFDQYMNKFEGEDLVHKVFFLFYSLGNVIMILNVNETSEHAPSEDDNYDGSYGGSYGGDYEAHFARYLASKGNRHVTCVAYQPYAFGFTLGWLVTRGSIFVMYCLIAHHVKPQGEYLLKSKSPILILSMLLISVNFFVDGSGDNYIHSYIIFAAGLLEFFGWMIWEVFIFGSCITKYVGRQVMIPVNIHHITSRTSTLIMLVLGEAVIALLTPTFKGSANNHYFFAIFGILIIFIYTFLYFDMQPRQHEPNALALGRFSGVLWLALHPMLAYTMFGIGMSLKLLYADLREHKSPKFSEQLLGGFLGTSLILMTLIRASHKTNLSRERILTFAIRMMLSSLHLGVGYATPVVSDNINVAIGLHIIICFLLIALDSWKYRHFETASPEASTAGAANTPHKPLPRRASVYAPQHSATKNFPGGSFNARSSMKRSSMFVQGNSQMLSGVTHRRESVANSAGSNLSGSNRELLKRSQSAHPSGASNPSNASQSKRTQPPRRLSSLNSREERIKEALSDFEKARPNVNVKQIRRSSMISSEPSMGSKTVRRASSNEYEYAGDEMKSTVLKGEDDNGVELQVVTGAVEKKPLTLEEIVGVVQQEEEKKDQELAMVVEQHSSPLGDVEEKQERNEEDEEDDEYDVEYVCYVDENGNVIEVDDEGHVISGGGGQLGSDVLVDDQVYEEEIVEVMYDVDEDEDGYNFDDYSDDEVEVIYEDADPPKSHITWL